MPPRASNQRDIAEDLKKGKKVAGKNDRLLLDGFNFLVSRAAPAPGPGCWGCGRISSSEPCSGVDVGV